jgi:pSer/pThr/pTyr-binding forkhead associated (FHA) protein
MAKLALWFKGAEHPRILDAEGIPPGTTWQIGRATGPPTTTICLHDQYVSVRHARLRFDPELELWQIADTNSKNGTYVGRRKIAGAWRSLRDGDRIVVGKSWIIVSYNPDDTLRGHKTVDGPTNVRPKTGLSWADVVALVLTGPDSFPNWLWWLLLLVAGILIAWIWRN